MVIPSPGGQEKRTGVPKQIPYQVVKNTFSNRIGQISNLSIRISSAEYGQTESDVAHSCAECTILTGLEIDAAKENGRTFCAEYVYSADLQGISRLPKHFFDVYMKTMQLPGVKEKKRYQYFDFSGYNIMYYTLKDVAMMRALELTDTELLAEIKEELPEDVIAETRILTGTVCSFGNVLRWLIWKQ